MTDSTIIRASSRGAGVALRCASAPGADLLAELRAWESETGRRIWLLNVVQ